MIDAKRLDQIRRRAMQADPVVGDIITNGELLELIAQIIEPRGKVYIVQSTAGVVEGVYTSEENARRAFTHWTHLELRTGLLNDLR
jgi:hypothetical protein